MRMKSIELHSVVPNVFLQSRLESDVWLADLMLERGKCYLVESESGAGKSSLCSFLLGIRGDYSGTILFDGEDIVSYTTEQWSQIRSNHIGVLYQDLKLFGELTAWENVRLKNDLTHFQSMQTVARWFEELGISDKADVRVDRLSYGQQQRVALVRALCQPLDFLLLDEPVSHLDERNGAIMANLILEQTRSQGAAVVVTSIGKHLDINYDKVLRL